MSKVIVIGAGLAGSLLAIYLAKRGIQVEVFEARGDMRGETVEGGRSINLALSNRGIAALRDVGMAEIVLADAVRMYGRMIHSVSGETKLLPYSGRKGEYINSVSRAELNIALMDEAERYPGVQFLFNHRCVGLNADIGEAMFANGRQYRGDAIFATDGAGSVVRGSMPKDVPNFEISEKFLEHGYKELHIPEYAKLESVHALLDQEKVIEPFAMEPNALHIWPRHNFMMIALPNLDGRFTCTLFLPRTHKKGHSQRDDYPGEEGRLTEALAGDNAVPAFDQLTDEASLAAFFKREFPDAVPLMPTLAEDFFRNPTGSLGTVKCWPWNIKGTLLLVGDSAHAMVPFYGQGMNCAFEDIRELDRLIAKHGTGNWEPVFWSFGDKRKFNTDAIADMAEENFCEMRDLVADPVFQRKRELETKLEYAYPEYFSKYSMVTFRDDMAYTDAQEKGDAQDRLLMEICSRVDDVSELDLTRVMAEVKALTYQTS